MGAGPRHSLLRPHHARGSRLPGKRSAARRQSDAPSLCGSLPPPRGRALHLSASRPRGGTGAEGLGSCGRLGGNRLSLRSMNNRSQITELACNDRKSFWNLNHATTSWTA